MAQAEEPGKSVFKIDSDEGIVPHKQDILPSSAAGKISPPKTEDLEPLSTIRRHVIKRPDSSKKHRGEGPPKMNRVDSDQVKAAIQRRRQQQRHRRPSEK